MQAQSVIIENMLYNDGMAGRPAKNIERTDFGERLLNARNSKGFSQRYIAAKLGITQPSYADWERRSMSIKPEYLPQLSAILDVAVEHLLGLEIKKRSTNGPVGRTRKAFEEVSKLPRHTQQRITSVVEELLVAHKAKS